jgi:hypothetical protein
MLENTNMRETEKQEIMQAYFQPWMHVAIFLLACAVIVSRRPDAIFNAQFWNEDGRVFFADAYNFGWWAALFRTYEGYLHVFPRLGAALALLVPLSFAPLAMNIIAIGVQALPANLLLSSRSSAWGSMRFRAFLACVYLALPNCWEINANITNSQWLLALCAVLLLVASRPLSIGGRLFDFSIMFLCGLTGPLCIFLLPVVLFLAWRHRSRWQWATAGVLAAACFVQACELLNGGFTSRPHYVLGAGPELFARLLAGHVYLGTLIGGNLLAAQAGLGYTLFLTSVAVGGTVLIAVCFLRSPMEMKLFLIICALILLASLISPTLGSPPGVSAWEFMAMGAGSRYWFFPSLAFAWSILWCFQSRIDVLKAVAIILLCIMSFGVALRWRHPAFRDMHFSDDARRVQSAPAGTVVTIPESTPGWYLTLVKH